ncbi:MAG: putative nucleic acid-binding Zn-ribbon protein [Saprospiraceae bacterium]|jgi:predicted  nucleic acid-binding Zn-ribbon protein
MVNTELTVAEKLKQLYDLQLIDSEIDEISVLKGELPIEVRDLEDEIVGLETRVNRLENNVADIEQEANRHQLNIKEAEALIERYEKQMDNVKNNREYDALQKELELQRLEIQLSEKKIRETSGVKVAKVETLNAAKEKLSGKKGDLEIKKVELEKIIEKTEAEEQKLMKKSEKARKKIEERLLKSYDRVRTSYRNGLAVVPVSRDSCGGCFNKIPPQVQLEIAMRKKILACEHCGRVLVDDNIMEVGTVK